MQHAHGKNYSNKIIIITFECEALLSVLPTFNLKKIIKLHEYLVHLSPTSTFKFIDQGLEIILKYTSKCYSDTGQDW